VGGAPDGAVDLGKLGRDLAAHLSSIGVPPQPDRLDLDHNDAVAGCQDIRRGRHLGGEPAGCRTT
jgi:hypothetical protein